MDMLSVGEKLGNAPQHPTVITKFNFIIIINTQIRNMREFNYVVHLFISDMFSRRASVP